MEIRLQTEAPDTIAPEHLNLAISTAVERKNSFPGTRKKVPLTGRQLSLSLLNKMTLVNSCEEGVEMACNLSRQSHSPFVVSFINAHCFNLCHHDASFRDAVLASDIVFRDGKGMEILCKSAGIDPGSNMCGTDSIPMVLQKLKDSSVALLGTEDRYLSKAAAVLREQGNRVVLTRNGFEAMGAYLDWIEEIRPKVIILGMGMPKQEMLSKLLKEKISYDCLIINGGAIIDHLGGKVSRAPKWMRKHGLEWLYRLMLEPRRLFNRYVIGNVMFMVYTYKAAGRIKL
jgi:exopolysaccharide biosynthesis WecB/TagA/CpsF family protein